MSSNEGSSPAGTQTTGSAGNLEQLYRNLGDDKPDFKRFYTEQQEPEKLQLFKHEIDWLQRYAKPTRNADVALAFGCNIQTVPHLMLAQVAVFKALGIDFVATAGQAYCCGSLLRQTGREDAAARAAYTSINRWASWQPRVNVHQCGSCYLQFAGRLDDMENETGSRPFEIVHLTEYLRDLLVDMGDAVPWKNPPRLRYLLHAEGSEVHESKEAARTAIIEMLACIPGVEYAGLVEDPTVGSPCGNGPRERTLGPKRYGTKTPRQDDITSDEYRQAQAEIAAQAEAANADIIITPHHKCHREWSKFGSERVPVMHYTVLLAQALGVTVPDRFQILWRTADPEKILEMTRPQWQSWNLSEPEARQLVTKYFVPEYASAVQECPCEGNCFETTISPDVIDKVSEPATF